MPELSKDPTIAEPQLRSRLEEVCKTFPESGKVWPRIRYANDVADWVAKATVKLEAGGADITRVTFIYLSGFRVVDAPEARAKLVTLTYSLEVIHRFIDGEGINNSTVTFDGYLMKLLNHFNRDLTLGFTQGSSDVSQTGLQGLDSDGRPEYVDGILSHRLIPTLDVTFRAGGC